MLALVSLLFALGPVLIYLWIILAMDRYDREPMSLVLANFGWGILCVCLLLLLNVFTGTLEDKIVRAPIIEETLKASFLLWTVRRRAFDNITDGVVYGMAIGLGFGMAENFAWFWNASTVGSWAVRIMERTLYTVIMHAMATGVVGMTFGYTKFRRPILRWPLRVGGLLLAIALHAYWNYAVIHYGNGSDRIDVLYILLSLTVIFLVLQLSLLTENRILRAELAEESERGLIPATHLQYLPYSTKRKFLGWLPPSIDRKQYIELTTRLAFRKYQCRHTDARHVRTYEAEVESLRNTIAHILDNEKHSPANILY